MSQADPANDKPHNQIARKLSIGLRSAQASGKDFYFILLDIAPANCLLQIKRRASLEHVGIELLESESNAFAHHSHSVHSVDECLGGGFKQIALHVSDHCPSLVRRSAEMLPRRYTDNTTEASP
jgi:hypothetical protein